MKPGDLVRHRRRIPTDPPRTGGFCDGWGEMGVIIRLRKDTFKTKIFEHAAEVLNQDGDILLVRTADLELIEKHHELEERLWEAWGDI